MEGIAPHAAADRAEARHRLPPRPGGGVLVLGGGDAAACDVTPPRIVGGEEGESDGKALWHRWISTALGDPGAVGF
jgi:hypothetical protein